MGRETVGYVPRGGSPGRNGELHNDCGPCAAQFLNALETRLLTSRGIAVRGPATCSQPVSAGDVDKTELAQATPAAIGDEAEVFSLEAQKTTVLKGFAVVLVASGVAVVDPWTQVEFGWEANGVRVSPYGQVQSPPSVNLQSLAACTITIPEGMTLRGIVRRTAGSATIFASVRVKGWAYTAPANVDNAGGAVVF